MTSDSVVASSPTLASLPERLWTALRPRPVPWPTVLAVAALMAYANGFVLTSIQGAVGAIQRTQSPFVTWLWTSTLTLPVYLAAVLVGLAFARRRLGPTLRAGRRILLTALLVATAGTVVGSAAVAASAVYDFHLQSQQLQLTSRLHGDHHAGAGGCAGLCASLQQTRDADERAARYASVADLAVNLVVVGWVLALRGGRLDSFRLARDQAGE